GVAQTEERSDVRQVRHPVEHEADRAPRQAGKYVAIGTGWALHREPARTTSEAARRAAQIQLVVVAEADGSDAEHLGAGGVCRRAGTPRRLTPTRARRASLRRHMAVVEDAVAGTVQARKEGQVTVPHLT